MSDTLSTAWALAWIRGAQAVMAENRMLLIELDRQIGDGDHGANMDKGFTAAVAKLEAGAAGPLYGTAFLRASPSALDARRKAVP